MKVIANTTILSNFAAVSRLDLLRDLLGEVYRSPYSSLVELMDKPSALE